MTLTPEEIEQGWQPAETAPRDGREIEALFAERTEPTMSHWSMTEGEWPRKFPWRCQSANGWYAEDLRGWRWPWHPWESVPKDGSWVQVRNPGHWSNMGTFRFVSATDTGLICQAQATFFHHHIKPGEWRYALEEDTVDNEQEWQPMATVPDKGQHINLRDAGVGNTAIYALFHEHECDKWYRWLDGELKPFTLYSVPTGWRYVLKEKGDTVNEYKELAAKIADLDIRVTGNYDRAKLAQETRTNHREELNTLKKRLETLEATQPVEPDWVARLTKERDEALGVKEQFRLDYINEQNMRKAAENERDEARKERDATHTHASKCQEERDRALERLDALDEPEPTTVSRVRLLESERTALARRIAELKNPAPCRWAFNDFECSWDSACGARRFLDDGGTPAEHGMRYCHKCGHPLEQVDPEEASDG